MRQKRLRSICSSIAIILALSLPQAVEAQDTSADIFGLDGGYRNNVSIEQTADGSWSVTTTGSDPYVATTALTRNLSDAETTLTFEYKSNVDANLEFFFSSDTTYSYATGNSIVLGDAPATGEWTRVKVDITAARTTMKWGSKGQSMRLDCGTGGDVKFQIRDLRICSDIIDKTEGFTMKDGVIQINTQEDFDKWVKASQGFVTRLYMPDFSVDLNTDATASNDSYIVHRMNKVFNGNGHTVTLNIVSEGGGCHFIQQLYGTIKNLTVDGSIEGKGKYISGVIGDTFDGAELLNITSAVNIISHVDGDGTHGGLVAVNKGLTLYKNCTFKGSIVGEKTTCCGGFVGWMDRTANFDGCLMIADINIKLDENGKMIDSNTIGRNPGNVRATNFYSLISMNAEGVEEKASIVTHEQMASGEVCFGLNGNQKEISWYQNIGEDPVPILDNTHKQVYATGEFNCDGTLLSETVSYGNEKTGTTIPDHSYTYGVCDNCGHFQPDYVTQEDGWFIVDTPEKMIYMAKYASVYTFSKIKITKDLDMSEVSEAYVPIINAFAGILDGTGHTISNLIITREEDNQALIGVAGACTVTNLIMDSSCYIEGNNYCASYVGQISGSPTVTLTNLITHATIVGKGVNAGGIIGCNMSSSATLVLTNCGVTGNVSGKNESGLISGWLGGDKATLTNCWATGVVTGFDGESTAFARPTNVTHDNCWCVQGKRDGVGQLTEDAAVSGELTWKLNKRTFVNPTWFQNLQEGDPYPSLDSLRGVVYPVGEEYATVHESDDESVQRFIFSLSDNAKQYVESEDVNKYCATMLLADYTELIEAYGNATDITSVVKIYQEEQAKRGEMNNSINAYKNYETAVNAVLEVLNTRTDFSGDDRDFLEGTYLGDNIEPGVEEKAPNGTYEYIMENRLLTNQELNKEALYVQELLRIAIANGYEPGTEITDVLANVNFADGFNGWDGDDFYGHEASPTEGSSMHAAESWGSTPRNMYQDIVVAKSGVYELQVRGGYRPFDDAMSTQLYPYIYLNDNANYLQAVIEDYISVDDAIDQVNCNIHGATPDKPILNEQGDTIGYALHGLLSCNKAFEAGRYDNRILVYIPNAGDTLRVGINAVYSEYGGNEWVGIGDIHLTYWGELAESDEALNRALSSMMARAKTLQNIAFSMNEDYVKYPNYSQSLKDALGNAITEAEGASDAEAKYASIQTLSKLFKDIIASKKAYKNYYAQVEKVVDHAYNAYEVDGSCQSLAEAATLINEQAISSYESGSLSTEEASKCDIVKTIDVIPVKDEDGVYHIKNSAHYSYFSGIANAVTNEEKLQVVLDADVIVSDKMVINNFYGTLDGQDHVIQVNLNPTGDNGALITNLRGATVKNLVVEGEIKTPHKYAAGVAAHSYVGSTLDRINSKVHISGSIAGDGTHGGILAVNDDGVANISNSIFSGSISGTANSNGGIIGWSGGGGSNVTGCLVIANITADPTNGNIIARNNVNAKNCYYQIAYGNAPATAIQVSDVQLSNGYTTYGLNGGRTRSDVVWRQNLDGSDICPTLNPEGKIVYMTVDSTYTNDIQNEIEKHEGTQDDPYVINSATDMALLRRFMVPGRMNYIELGNDIDMAEIKEWTPLNMDGDKANNRNYQNIIDFDGKGHVISNFTCTDEKTSYNSFFGILNGNVRNVGFKDANVSSAKSGTGILAGYMGHDEYKNADATKTVSRMENVWVTGTLNVASSYAGGLIGNVGGPCEIKNCYTNVEITSDAAYVGGLVGRVRGKLSIDQVYAAGSISGTLPTASVGGIIGGGQNSGTNPGYYNNIVVWNNTDRNFGPLVPAVDKKLPKADLLDIVFNEDGIAVDQSPMNHKVEVVGEPKVVYNEQYKQNALITEANDSTAEPISFLKVDYKNNQEFMKALENGYTLETTFKILNKEIITQIKPFSSENGAGLGFELDPNGAIKHVVFTDNNGDKTFRRAQSSTPVVMDTYYHFVGTYDKATRKVTLYINGDDKSESSAEGTMYFTTDTLCQWFGIGADPGTSGNGNGGNFEILSARIYNEAVSEDVAKAMYYQQKGLNFFAGDKQSNISYYDGNNFAALQQVVVDWGKPWQCDMQEGSYPTFDGTLADGIQNVTGNLTKGKIYNINGIRVEKTTKGIYIIDGKKVVVK